ncbi:ABC transporter permease [Roseimaritima ulvae]|uniref:ABC-2 family transporter protein n=1 Tax=Roseimaritima ulvae TaxID=980254 RepID=A0A5B9QMW2_9BACT|nr:ABC transporter permease [Roseimaritima ulvae]QEG40294.1 ABC-2 family transporter protein [Roseimaritima ulvae]
MSGMQPHPLTLDPEGQGIWGWVDRASEKASGWLNPILIKEARQALKSKQFVITFFSLLACSWIWTVMGIVANSPDVYYVSSGQDMLYGYYFVLAIPMLGMVPLVAHRSLAAEIDDGTFEMLAITKLSSMRIVLGKLNSAMLQMLIYFAAVVPGLAFSYLLRGVNMPTLLMMVLVIFFAAMLVTTFGLLIATLASHRAWQVVALLGVLAVVVGAQFLCGAFCLEAILEEDAGSIPEAWLFTGVFGLVGAGCMVLFVKAAAARIAPVTENRSTGLRWSMFALQLLWVFAIVFIPLYYASTEYSYIDAEPINFGMMVVCGYWLLMGSLMLAESPELSPRVQRTLPSTFFGRMFLLWFNPGPGTGYMFAICSGTAAMFTMALFASSSQFLTVNNSTQTFPTSMALLMSGYLMGYLSLVRLIVMPISWRLGRSFVLPVVVLVAVLFLGVATPSIIMVSITGELSRRHSVMELPNWGWTLDEAFSGGIDWPLAVLAFGVGGVLFAVNLLLFFREFTYRRIAEPQRLQAEQQEESEPADEVLQPS